jgi:DNA primase
MDIIELLKDAGLEPKRKAACHGGEYCSPCPFCKDGDDRFLTWPQRHNKNGEYQGGRFQCRVCQKYGDAITFLRELHGLSYRDACAQLKIEPKQRAAEHRLRANPVPLLADEPSELWKEKAAAFVKWCHEKLMNDQDALSLVFKRGFTLESISRFKLGFNPGEKCRDIFRDREDWGLDPELKDDGKLKKLWLPIGITVPTFSPGGHVVKVKIRRSEWKEGDKLPKYVGISGSKRSASIYGNAFLKTALILESELDGLLILQEAGELCYTVALGGSSQPLDLNTSELLKRTPIVLFCPDYDSAGAAAWLRWKKMFPSIERILTPHEKAPGDAFLAGVDLREWIEETIKSVNRKRGI